MTKKETEIKKAFSAVKYKVKQRHINDDYQLFSESVSKEKTTKTKDSLQVLNELNLTKSNKIELKKLFTKTSSSKKNVRYSSLYT
ncbi:MAG: hypothetical protein RR439_07180 [Carnobacterium sp.]